jgi:hypothetical protein
MSRKFSKARNPTVGEGLRALEIGNDDNTLEELQKSVMGRPPDTAVQDSSKDDRIPDDPRRQVGEEDTSARCPWGRCTGAIPMMQEEQEILYYNLLCGDVPTGTFHVHLVCVVP